MKLYRKVLVFAHGKGDMLTENDQRFPYCHKCTGKYQNYFYEKDRVLKKTTVCSKNCMQHLPTSVANIKVFRYFWNNYVLVKA